MSPIITDVWRHPESDGNAGRPFTAKENVLLGITAIGVLAARGTGRMCVETWGAGYFKEAMLVSSDTTRAIQGMLEMQSGAAEYCIEKQLPKMRIRNPRRKRRLREPDHGSADWTVPNWPWEQPFASTGDTIAKCYGRVGTARGELALTALSGRYSRIIVVCSGHVCRLLAMAVTMVGSEYWDKLSNPKNCEGYRIGPEAEIINMGLPSGKAPKIILRGNGVAVYPIPGI